jgi:pimeloyl-ACP methyl ester carboxylesterase
MSLPGRKISVNGIELHVHEQGSGRPVLLLHGFPDSSSLWRHQVPALVAAGYRAIVPDQRGFGESSKPLDPAAYQLPVVLGDAVGLLDALGVQRAHVVAHDWGAAVGWLLAGMFPDRVASLVAMSVGHPGTFAGAPIEQREKSWYFLLFQFDGVEEWWRRDDWKLFRQWTRHHPELARWIPDLSRPGALTAALNWYRGNVHPAASAVDAPPPPPVVAPTLGIWSAGDAYLTEHVVYASTAFVTGRWSYVRIEDASHWIPIDRPERVNRLLLEHLASSG